MPGFASATRSPPLFSAPVKGPCTATAPGTLYFAVKVAGAIGESTMTWRGWSVMPAGKFNPMPSTRQVLEGFAGSKSGTGWSLMLRNSTYSSLAASGSIMSSMMMTGPIFGPALAEPNVCAFCATKNALLCEFKCRPNDTPGSDAPNCTTCV